MEQEFERLIGYQFQDRGFMEEALEEAGLETAGNERLALLGDTILSLMLLRRWYCEGNTTGRYAPVIVGHYTDTMQSKAQICVRITLAISD
jgi:dsRNA-specific ribonuclease